MSRRLLAVPLALLGLLLAAPAALAVGPSAIGVDTDGVSYVGFAEAGPIQRIKGTKNDSTGEPDRLSSWGVVGTAAGQLGTIVGIDVAPGADGSVWVLDSNRRVSKFTKSGAYLGSAQLSACQSNYAVQAGVYGGLEVRASEDGDGTAIVRDVYVAHPCANEIERIDPTSFEVKTAATTFRPGHVTAQRFASAPSGTNAVFVADPAGKRVSTFDPTSLAAVSGGTRTYSYTPSDVHIDAEGVLFVGDVDNNQIHQYNASGSEFRTLGSTGSAAGQLNSPQAFDVFANYSDFATNIFIADTGNSRVQRWNTFGFTYWMAAATSGGTATPAAPSNSVAPSIPASSTVGQTLTCEPGSWSGSPTFTYSWRRDGSPVASTSQYTLVAADAGRSITCVVTGTNGGGQNSATSNAVTPAAAPVTPAPANTGAPAIQGSVAVGQQLTCTQGSWSNSPTGYTYSWRRDGNEVATGAQYTLTSADAGRSITCVVTATNAGGSSTATSSAVSPPTPTTPVAAPVNTARPGIQGTPVVGNTLTGTQGSFSNTPTGYACGWRRDGVAIAGATGTTYALVAADAGRTISFAVTATNSGGSATAVSDGVAVTAAPTTPSTRVGVTINGGAEATSSAAVSLRIREPAGATAVVISNDGSFDTPTQVAVAANDTYSWTLDSRGSERRARVVYVRFVGALIDGNQTFTDDILLDTTAPTVTTATVNARTSARTATAKVAATDSGSGVSTIQYAKNQSPTGAKTLKLTKTRSFKVKPKNARWVRAVDVAGNKSKWKRIAYKAPRKAARKR